MRHELRVFESVEDLARAGASYIYDLSREGTSGGPFSLALSGGRTPWRMLQELTTLEVAWDDTVIFQVDERVAAEGSDERNLTHLQSFLDATKVRVDAMDVNNVDLEGAAQRYASGLPERLDLVHLGLGPDGHCASLVPHDPVLEVTDRLVALTNPYQNTRRMTFTYPAITRADRLLWLVSGSDKREALAKLLDGDRSIPAGRVEAGHSLIMADRTAVPL